MRVCGVLFSLFFPFHVIQHIPANTDTHKRWVFFFVISPNQYSNMRLFNAGRVLRRPSYWIASSRAQQEKRGGRRRRRQSMIVSWTISQQAVGRSQRIRSDESILATGSRSCPKRHERGCLAYACSRRWCSSFISYFIWRFNLNRHWMVYPWGIISVRRRWTTPQWLWLNIKLEWNLPKSTIGILNSR